MAKSADNAASSTPIEIFISYSHKDAELLPELHDALATLRRLGYAIYWDDRKIDTGEEWKGQIDEHLNTADVILLLISFGFIASDFCYDIEMNRAIQRHEANEARVIPILLKPCDWQKLPFAKLQGLPEGTKPVTKWDDRAEAWTSVATGIRTVVEELIERKKAAVIARPPEEFVRIKIPTRPTAPAIWNVPHNQNRNFTGREGVLAKLHEALASGGSAALTQAITGLGGVGKTQTAIEYAYRYAADYDLVWWIRSEEPAKLAADYAGLAKPFGIAEERELNLTVQAVKAELARRERWLLVFDNANKVEEVRDYLPPTERGHVLITSRDPNWLEVAEPLGITTWTRQESVAFLLKRTKQTEEAAAKGLAEALGDLPLALEQAAAYVVENAKSLADYMRLFRERAPEVLRRGKAPAGYHATVATTWELAFAEVEKTSEVAAQLMNLCAFLAPDEIGRGMLRSGAKFLPSPLKQAVADDLLWDEAVRALRSYSLIEVKNDAISVHRLVQTVVRDRIEEEGRKKWAERAAEVINDQFPLDSDDVRTWTLCARLLPHAQTAAERAEELEVGLVACERLLNQIALYFWGRGELLRARSVSERCLQLCDMTQGPDGTGRGPNEGVLGLILMGLGDLAGAQLRFERALKIDEAAYGPHHAEVARDLNNLGTLFCEKGDFADAQVHFERALKVTEAVKGPDHSDVSIVLNNLGNVLAKMNDLPTARLQYERALKIAEAAKGVDHPQVATVLANMGLLFDELGDSVRARSLLDRALGICEKSLGQDHPDTKVVRKKLESLG